MEQRICLVSKRSWVRSKFKDGSLYRLRLDPDVPLLQPQHQRGQGGAGPQPHAEDALHQLLQEQSGRRQSPELLEHSVSLY